MLEVKWFHGRVPAYLKVPKKGKPKKDELCNVLDMRVSPNGGRTDCLIFVVRNEVIITIIAGFSYCSHSDIFDEFEGSARSLGRALDVFSNLGLLSEEREQLNVLRKKHKKMQATLKKGDITP